MNQMIMYGGEANPPFQAALMGMSWGRFEPDSESTTAAHTQQSIHGGSHITMPLCKNDSTPSC